MTSKKISDQIEDRVLRRVRQELRSDLRRQQRQRDRAARSQTSSHPPLISQNTPVKRSSELWWFTIAAAAMFLMFGLMGGMSWLDRWRGLIEPESTEAPVPLVMQGGDPYIRALMRTISASESNNSRPYSILYGGDHVNDLSRHPDECITIMAGPNFGNCSTAAGRYQMLTTTWEDMARRYHPNPPIFFWSSYDFAPAYQDEVVYRWLSDPAAWGVDLSQLLQQGKTREVLKILSPTWTSLGYGIEPNSMTSQLPEIYEKMLKEELQQNSAQANNRLAP